MAPDPFITIFARQLCTMLSCHAEVSTHCKNRELYVWGNLALTASGETGENCVPVHIVIAEDWEEIPPPVYAFGDFIRKDSSWNWHAGEAIGTGFPSKWSARVCYVLATEWKAFLRELRLRYSDESIIYQCASTWLLSSLNSLLSRQLIAHRQELTDWPEKWSQWEHGKAGVDAFISNYEAKPWFTQFHEVT